MFLTGRGISSPPTTWPRQALRARENKKGRGEFLGLHALRASLHPPDARIAIVLDNFRPAPLDEKNTPGRRLSEGQQRRTRLPHYASWLDRIEAQFTALRYFCLDGTDHESHEAQAFLIRRYIAWRSRHAQDKALRELVKHANIA